MTGSCKLWTLVDSTWEQSNRLVSLCDDHWTRAQAHLYKLDNPFRMHHSWSLKDIQALCKGLERKIWWGSGGQASEHCNPTEMGQPLRHQVWQIQREGHCATMDSAYMDDIMALIGSHRWKINMVGIAQENRTDADTSEEKKAVKRNTSCNGAAWQLILVLCNLIRHQSCMDSFQFPY